MNEKLSFFLIGLVESRPIGPLSYLNCYDLEIQAVFPNGSSLPTEEDDLREANEILARSNSLIFRARLSSNIK